MLLSANRLRSRVEELAEEIDRHYGGREVVAVAVLKGAFVFAADLLRCMQTPASVEFVCLASYGQGVSSCGTVSVELDVACDVSGREVLIVEDIVDTGRSMRFLIEHLYDLGAADVKVCALLDKPSRREVQIEPDWVGFVVPDVFVVGYGIDHAQRYRGLPDVWRLAGGQ